MLLQQEIRNVIDTAYTITLYVSAICMTIVLLWKLMVVWFRYMLQQLPNQYFTESQINNHSSKKYNVEKHRVNTEDGHELIVQHIVLRNGTTDNSKRPVVFMQHGLLETSGIFVLSDFSLAFLMAEAGYDVWLGNNRTSHYGQEKFSKSEDFSFSIDDLIKYDFPAMVDYIIENTQCERINFVGQSQGAGQCFGALSSQPSLKNKFDKCVLLSPAIFLKKMPDQWFLQFLMKIPATWFGDAEFLPAIVVFSRIMPWQLTAIAGKYIMKLMGFIDKDIGGDSLYHRSTWFANIPTGCTSVNNVLHWLELLRHGGCIRRFSSEKSCYKVDHMLSEWQQQQPDRKIHIFLGQNDCVVDVYQTTESFAKYSDFCSVHVYEGYGHTDFIWSAKEHVEPIYHQILSLMKHCK
jgi:pimeloyl-ACP methyl ester carboxylesterase